MGTVFFSRSILIQYREWAVVRASSYAQTHLDYSVRIISIRRKKNSLSRTNLFATICKARRPSPSVPHNVSWSLSFNNIIHRRIDTGRPAVLVQCPCLFSPLVHPPVPQPRVSAVTLSMRHGGSFPKTDERFSIPFTGWESLLSQESSPSQVPVSHRFQQACVRMAKSRKTVSPNTFNTYHGTEI